MKPLDKGVYSGMQMPQIQCNCHFSHWIHDFRFIAIFVSLPKDIKGHQENFNREHKKQIKKHNWVLLHHGDVLECHKSDGNDGFSIGSLVLRLWQVSSCFLRPFTDTTQISTRGIKTKLGNGIVFRFLLQVCVGKGEMNSIPIDLLETFSKYFSIVKKLHCMSSTKKIV